MLYADDPIDWRPQRVAVAGVTGVGKTTLARRISDVTGLPHTELDALFHGACWEPRPNFVADVVELVGRATWVTEWQYADARDVIAARADTLVWLDLPARVALTRVLGRTVRRSIRREELWNGNSEPALRTVFTNRDHILRWALRTQRKLKTRVPAVERRHPELRVVRLRSQRDVDVWIRALTARCRHSE